jgi:hypothetical protein
LGSLAKAVQLSEARQTAQPGSKSLRATAAADPRFAALQTSAEFQKLVKPK